MESFLYRRLSMLVRFFLIGPGNNIQFPKKVNYFKTSFPLGNLYKIVFLLLFGILYSWIDVFGSGSIPRFEITDKTNTITGEVYNEDHNSESPSRVSKLACPEIKIFSYLGQSGTCINNGVEGIFTASLLGALPSGIQSGSEWIVDWGDGSQSTYTSASDDDFPYLTHTYTDVDECNYVATWSVENPCGENDNASSVIVVHGRDIETDGDGALDIVDNNTGSNVIQVCEGLEVDVVLRDNSTWNCQNPVLPLGLTSKPNNDDRYIQWLYGVDGDDITGSVNIEGNAAPYIGTSYLAPTAATLSQVITIPATSKAGEKFTVTMRNWNKCNPDPGDNSNYIETSVDIVVIASTSVTAQADFSICESEISGTSITLNASGGGGSGEFDWTIDGPDGTNVYTNKTSPFTLDVSDELSIGDNAFNLTHIEASSGFSCGLSGSPISSTVIHVDADVSNPSTGPDDNICEINYPDLNGNIPLIGSGLWSIQGASSAILDLNTDPNTGVTNLDIGSNTFRWTITNGVCEKYEEITIISNQKPDISLPVDNPTICAGETAAITLSNSVAGVEYLLRLDLDNSTVAGPFAGNGGDITFNVSPAITTVYNILATVSATACNDVLSNKSTVSVNAIPTPVITGSNDLCLNASETYTTPPDATHSFQWTAINGNINGSSSENSVTVDWLTVTNSAILILKETIDLTGCSVTTPDYIINVNAGKTTAKKTISGLTQKCEDDTLKLTYKSVTDAISYVWDFSWEGGIINETSTDPSIEIDLTGLAPGLYSVKVAGINGCNLDPDPDTGDYPWTTNAHEFEIYERPSADAGSGGEVCNSLSFELNAIPSVGTGNWTLTDSPSGASVINWASGQNSANTLITVDLYGEYEFTWTEENGACSSSDQVIVTFYEQPTADAGSGGSVCGSLDYDLGASAFEYAGGNNENISVRTWTMTGSPAGASATNWSAGQNSAITTVTVDTYGAYKFTWTEKNGNCTSSDEISVSFYEQPLAEGGSNDELSASLDYSLSAMPYTYLPPPHENSGTGLWTLQSSTTGGTVTNWGSGADNPDPDITIDKYSEYLFRWTETNGTCTDFEEITIRFVEEADAGSDQILCNVFTTKLEGNNPSTGIGTWSKISGPGDVNYVSSVNDPTTEIMVDQYGEYVFRWSFNIGTAPLNESDVKITFKEQSNVIDITESEQLKILAQPLGLEICEGENMIFTIDGDYPDSLNYQWYVNMNNDDIYDPVINGGSYSGATSTTLTITNAPFSLDNNFFMLEISGECGAPVNSDTIELFVNKKPEITLQPEDSIACELSNVSFRIDAGETDDPEIQWYQDAGTGFQMITDEGKFIGTNSTILKIFGVDSSMSTYTYEAKVSNSCGAPLTSLPATLTVNDLPKIWNDPEDVIICENNDTLFHVSASGSDIEYSWFVNDGSSSNKIINDATYSGQGSETLQLNGVERTINNYKYFVKISNACKTNVQSQAATLSIKNPPEIFIEPEDNTICENRMASFEIHASGSEPEYHWFESSDKGLSFHELSDEGFYVGTKQSRLNIFNVDRTYNEYLYRVVINGMCTPSVQSKDVLLSVNYPPEIELDPVDTTVCNGELAGFSVDAKGSDLIFQWKVSFNDGTDYVDILADDPSYSGMQSANLIKLSTNASVDNGLKFRVEVSGACPLPKLSDPAKLTVNSIPVITSQPKVEGVCEGESALLNATVSGYGLNYQWELSDDGGINWTVLTENDIYKGVKSDQLTISNTEISSMSDNLYRLIVSSLCAPVISDAVKLTIWTNPSPGISGDLPDFPAICGGEVLNLNGNPTGGSGIYTSHTWTGDILYLNTTNTQSAAFKSKIKGDYNLNYSVRDSHGCTGKETVVIKNFMPAAKFSSDAKPDCGGRIVNFTNQSSSDAITYFWDFGNGSESTGKNPVSTFDNVNPDGVVQYFNVKLVVTDSLGCTDTTQSIITVYPKIDPEIIATPITGCQPLKVNFQTNPNAASYYWDFGDQKAENGSYVADHTFINQGTTIKTFKTILKTASAYGCITTDTVNIVVNPIPHPQFSDNSQSLPEFPESGNAIITFENLTTPGPWSFVYDFGDGSSKITTNDYNNITHEYSAPGTYDVIMYANTTLCSDSALKSIIINPRDPEAIFNSIDFGCHPLTVKFTNDSKFASSFTWEFGDGELSIEKNPTHIYYQPGEFTVKLIAKGLGGTTQSSKVINVNPTPLVLFNSAPDSVYVSDMPVRFFNLSSYADSYRWDFGDVSMFDGSLNPDNNSSDADPTHVYMYEGWKDVRLTAWNEFCRDSLTITKAVKVIPAGKIIFPNIFLPGDSPTGGNTNNLSDPSEVNSVFFPGVSNQVQEYHLYIYTRWGELIFQTDDVNTGWDGFIQDKKAAQGVYIWKVTGIYSNGSPFREAGDVTLIWH